MPFPKLEKNGPKKSWSPSNGRASKGERLNPIETTTTKAATAATTRSQRRGISEPAPAGRDQRGWEQRQQRGLTHGRSPAPVARALLRASHRAAGPRPRFLPTPVGGRRDRAWPPTAGVRRSSG